MEAANNPSLSFNGGPADAAADICFREAVTGSSGEREVLYRAPQAFGSSIAKKVAVKLITTALGDDVEDTAGRLAVLGAVSTRLDFHFLHKLERQVRARSTESRIGSVHAIQNVIVLWPRRSTNGRIAITARRITQTRTRHGPGDCVEALKCTLSRAIRKLLAVNS